MSLKKLRLDRKVKEIISNGLGVVAGLVTDAAIFVGGMAVISAFRNPVIRVIGGIAVSVGSALAGYAMENSVAGNLQLGIIPTIEDVIHIIRERIYYAKHPEEPKVVVKRQPAPKPASGVDGLPEYLRPSSFAHAAPVGGTAVTSASLLREVGLQQDGPQLNRAQRRAAKRGH